MANDPNRDLLPVREDGCKSGKGFSDKFDHHILGKLSRCELEDRFLRLLDEQTHIKKLANSQEEKIKKLGTKLLRLINEKKNGKKLSEQCKEREDLNLRIIELEHENYTLRDKNTVLKQQLSSHSRHLSARSPIRSNHTSPLMTMRQCAPPLQSEGAYETTNKNEADLQLQEAEAHIRELNEEIKSLHCKIDYLQQNLEKNNLDNRKVKVSENIELIRLQRSLKQQAIQIAALQEQVKNSEKTQKILKEDLIKAHNENDEALHLISVKQNEILTLCSKLEETNLNRLEEDELKERIKDLMIERDCLKERSDFLMKSIGAKAEESEKINELQKQLCEEKAKKEKLEEALESLKASVKNSSTTAIVETVHSEKIKTVYRAQQTTPEKKEMINSACNTFDDSESSRSQESSMNRELESDTDRDFSCEKEPTEIQKITIKRRHSHDLDGKHVVEKMRLELELQYLREMLRSQTLRCEAQQAEISRLMYELKLNEDKCSETLQRLDWHLRIFETLEMRAHQNEVLSSKPLPEPKQVMTPTEPKQVMSPTEPRHTETRRVMSPSEPKPVMPPNEPKSVMSLRNESPSSIHREYSRKINNSERDYYGYRRRQSSEENLPSKLVSSSTHVQQLLPSSPPRLPQVSPTRPPSLTSQPRGSPISAPVQESETRNRYAGPEHKKRFIEQTFLESSDEEVQTTEKSQYGKKVDKDHRDSKISSVKYAKSLPKKRDYSDVSLTKNTSESSLPSKPYERDYKTDTSRYADDVSFEDSHTITITILWFRIKSDSSLWRNDNIDMFFVDFTFLDVNGAETETPQSLPKPRNPDKKCEFNFTQTIDVVGNRLKMFEKLVSNRDSALFVFKLVSDSDKYDGTNNECEDIGVAVLTAKEFCDFCNKGPFNIHMKNSDNNKEVIGTLGLSVEATSKLLNLIQ